MLYLFQRSTPLAVSTTFITKMFFFFLISFCSIRLERNCIYRIYSALAVQKEVCARYLKTCNKLQSWVLYSILSLLFFFFNYNYNFLIIIICIQTCTHSRTHTYTYFFSFFLFKSVSLYTQIVHIYQIWLVFRSNTCCST